MSNQQTYRVRTYEQLWDALQRFIRREVVMSIPVDMERDADMILADGIHELRALRAKVAEQENTQPQPATKTPLGCSLCGRTLSQLPDGTLLAGIMPKPGETFPKYCCFPECPPKAPTDGNQGEGATPPPTPTAGRGLPHYDHGDTVLFILEHMMDTERPHSERFPEDLIDEGCICRRLIENVLDWQQVHIEKQDATASDATATPAPTE